MIDTAPFVIFQQDYPPDLLAAFRKLAIWQMPIFLAGGAVRDLIMGRVPVDFDLTVPSRALAMAHSFAEEAGGAYVLLDEEAEVARVVKGDCVIDFSSFREKTTTIEEDLQRRDFTINAMALPLDPGTGMAELSALIDPCGGRNDLAAKVVRFTSATVFQEDPLRLLRAYRFAACLGFRVSDETETVIREEGALISRVSPERVSHELELIIASPAAHPCFAAMADSALLFTLFPELGAGVGLGQPGSHHLDVFRHNLEALACIEKMMEDPGGCWQAHGDRIAAYLASPERRRWLKWAAFFHDIGKPATHSIRRGRITFYDHDQCGAQLFSRLAARLKWSRRDQGQVAKLIRLHMWPFHLSNSLKKTGIKAKACLKIHQAAGDDLTGLFLLAMADSLAAAGPGKPLAMENELLTLFARILKVIAEKIQPVSGQPPILTGDDLIRECGLQPGPIFSEIFRKLEEVQVVNRKMNRDEALSWVRNYLASAPSRHSPGVDHRGGAK